jgi:hypothetical protein
MNVQQNYYKWINTKRAIKWKGSECPPPGPFLGSFNEKAYFQNISNTLNADEQKKKNG